MKSFGVTVTLGGTAIGKLTDANISGRDVNNIDITTHGSPGSREFIGGLIDNGSLELTGNYDIDNAGQLALSGWEAQTKVAIVTLSDGTVFTFSAIVGPLNTTNPLDDKVEFTCSLKITGDIVIS